MQGLQGQQEFLGRRELRVIMDLRELKVPVETQDFPDQWVLLDLRVPWVPWVHPVLKAHQEIGVLTVKLVRFLFIDFKQN